MVFESSAKSLDMKAIFCSESIILILLIILILVIHFFAEFFFGGVELDFGFRYSIIMLPKMALNW